MLPTKKFAFKIKPNLANGLKNGDGVGEASSSSSPNYKSKNIIRAELGFEIEENSAGYNDELITGFTGKQAISANPKINKGPMIIPFKGNSKSWRHKKVVSYIPPGVSQTDGKAVTISKMEAADPSTYGLQIRQKVPESLEFDTELQTEPKKVLSLEEEATEALIVDANDEFQSDVKVDIIPLLQTSIPRSEAELFKEDVISRPDECTLEDYERVPVEQFGAALLRGMGWKDGQPIGSKKRVGTYKAIEFQRRERLLGLGAKSKPSFLEPNRKKARQ